MVFSHPFFVYAFLAVLFIAFFAVKGNAARRGILIAFSLIFYGCHFILWEILEKMNMLTIGNMKIYKIVVGA